MYVTRRDLPLEAGRGGPRWSWAAEHLCEEAAACAPGCDSDLPQRAPPGPRAAA